jgi:hypothetical protein
VEFHGGQWPYCFMINKCMMSVTFKGFAYFFDEITHTRSDLPCSCGVIGGLQIFADKVINA